MSSESFVELPSGSRTGENTFFGSVGRVAGLLAGFEATPLRVGVVTVALDEDRGGGRRRVGDALVGPVALVLAARLASALEAEGFAADGGLLTFFWKVRQPRFIYESGRNYLHAKRLDTAACLADDDGLGWLVEGTKIEQQQLAVLGT